MSPTPRDASTVILVRESAEGVGLDVWLMHRINTLAFAAGAHVFPGGAVDPGDHDPNLPVRGRSFESMANAMSTTQDRARSLVAAAVRETFEECGVVLAAGTAAGRWTDEDRLDLLGGRRSVADLLNRDDAVVDLDALVPWAWWLTPDFIPRRYDTWFFLARVPPSAEPAHIGDGEAVDARWWGVTEALEANRRGAMMLLPPTLSVLTDLAGAGSFDEAFDRRPTSLEQRSG